MGAVRSVGLKPVGTPGMIAAAMSSGEPQSTIPAMLDRAQLKTFYELVGADLVRRGISAELVLCDGCGIVLQFGSRQALGGVEGFVRRCHDDVVGISEISVARRMGLPLHWLNETLKLLLRPFDHDAAFDISGNYPRAGLPGLRVVIERPSYVLAMKVQALASFDQPEKDLVGARMMASSLGIGDADDLRCVYASIHGVEPSDDFVRRSTSLLEAS